jgi:hypothetical protein
MAGRTMIAQPKVNPLIKAQMGTFGTGGEIFDKTYYDTIVLDHANTAGYSMFTIPKGQGTPAKGYDLTNMISQSQIAQGHKMTVKALLIRYMSKATRQTANVQMIYDVLRNFYGKIVIPGKDNIGDWTFAELMGTASLIALTPTAAGDNIPLISPQFCGVKHLKIPIVLSALTTFSFEVLPVNGSDVALDGDFIQIGLRGILRRSS